MQYFLWFLSEDSTQKLEIFSPFLAGRGVCCDFFDIIYDGKADRNERVTEKGKRPEPTLHKNGKLVQLLTKMATFSCSLKQELFWPYGGKNELVGRR